MPDPNPTATPPPTAEPVATPEPAPLQVPLESDESAPATPAVTPPATPPAPDTPAPPAPEPQKMVPLAAVQEERQKRQKAEEFRDRAQPIIDILFANPDLIAAVQARAKGEPVTIGQPPTPPPAQDTAELEAIAKNYILYKPDGSGALDLEAAARVRDGIERVANNAAESAIKKHVTPMQQQLAMQTAQTQRQKIEATAQQHGVSLQHLGPLLDQAIASDPNVLNDPQVGAALIITAKGIQAFGAGATPAPPQPPATPATPSVIPVAPLVTETPGARPAAVPDVPDMMKNIARRRGWKIDRVAKTFDRMGGGFTPLEKEE